MYRRIRKIKIAKTVKLAIKKYCEFTENFRATLYLQNTSIGKCVQLSLITLITRLVGRGGALVIYLRHFRGAKVFVRTTVT